MWLVLMLSNCVQKQGSAEATVSKASDGTWQAVLIRLLDMVRSAVEYELRS